MRKYVVCYSSVYECENDFGVYAICDSLEEAIEELNKSYERDLQEYLDYDQEEIIKDKSNDAYSIYVDGIYSENHIDAYIQTFEK